MIKIPIIYFEDGEMKETTEKDFKIKVLEETVYQQQCKINDLESLVIDYKIMLYGHKKPDLGFVFKCLKEVVFGGKNV